MQRKERIRVFVQTIWDWYSRNKRVLPWRDLPDRDPSRRAYKVLVSEIMLQQTQVSRVIVKYREFLERFPTPRSLAETSNRDVLIAWKGMGYNSRALRLRDAAAVIYGGRGARCCASTSPFPKSMDELRGIPGIGHYTAAAIRNFAFNLPTPCLDTNIRRILHRTFVGPAAGADGSWKKNDKYLLEIAEEVLLEALHQGTTADWHAALMDFGSLVQTKRNPKWDICPLTALRVMKANQKNFHVAVTVSRKEPGRLVGSMFIPNRIFRGKIVDALRDAERGLSLHALGRHIALDWNPSQHRAWLARILAKLQEEKFLELRKGKFCLSV